MVCVKGLAASDTTASIPASPYLRWFLTILFFYRPALGFLPQVSAEFRYFAAVKVSRPSTIASSVG